MTIAKWTAFALIFLLPISGVFFQNCSSAVSSQKNTSNGEPIVALDKCRDKPAIENVVSTVSRSVACLAGTSGQGTKTIQNIQRRICVQGEYVDDGPVFERVLSEDYSTCVTDPCVGSNCNPTGPCAGKPPYTEYSSPGSRNVVCPSGLTGTATETFRTAQDKVCVNGSYLDLGVSREEITSRDNSNCQTGAVSCSQDHELPIVTHWNPSVGVQFGANGQITFRKTPLDNYVAGRCYYTYSPEFVPAIDNYIGENFSTRVISDEYARSFIGAQCERTAQAFRLLRPDNMASIKTRLQGHNGVVQIITGAVVADSMVNIYLPANYNPNAPAGSYPILFNGFYDTNETSFGLLGIDGPLMADLMALSTAGGRPGAIGIVWNGGGAIASRTANPNARAQFNQVVQYVAEQFGADPMRIISFGGSRGGSTSLMIAANPENFPYRVKAAYSAVPPVSFGSTSTLQGATFPLLLGAVEWSTGLRDSWRPGWRYPSCTNRPEMTGLSGPQAHIQVVTGTPDPTAADNEHSLMGDKFVNGLLRAGTKIFLEVGSHDYICPFAFQVAYINKLQTAGVTVDANIALRAGHSMYNPNARNFLVNALISLLAGQEPQGNSTLNFYRVNRSTKFLETYNPPDKRIPFTLEVPFKFPVGMIGHIIATGEPGTRFHIQVTLPDGNIMEVQDVIGNGWNKIIETQINLIGNYTYRFVKIKKPGDSSWRSLNLAATPSESAALVTYGIPLPQNVDGSQAQDILLRDQPSMLGYPTNWGITDEDSVPVAD